MKAELFPGEGMPQHRQALIGQRQPARHRQPEAPKLVRCVAHPDADLDPPATDIVQHRQVLGLAEIAANTRDTEGKLIVIGVAMLEGDRASMDLIQRADEKLYEAKHAGRNRVIA